MINVIIIPARAGSKRLKNKNIFKIKNKTLVERTLEISKKIKNVDKIIVSSNDPKILAYSKKFKNIYFIKRPMNLSTSRSLLIDTINHLNKLFDKKFSNILVLQPTSPYRSLKFINNNWLKFIKKRKKFKLNFFLLILKKLKKKKK